MNPQEIDVIVRVAGATLLLWAAVAPGGQTRARPYFIPLAICLAGFLAGNTPDAGLRLTGPPGSVAALIAGYGAAFLWWWCLAVFDRSFRPRGAVLALGVAWIAVASLDRGLFGAALEGIGLSWLLIAMGLAMVGHLAWRLLRDVGDDLIDRRRRARVLVVAVAAAQLLADMALDLAMGFEWGPRWFMILQNGALLAFTGWLLSLDLVRGPTVRRKPPAAGAEPDPVLAARLKTLMEVQRIHLDPDLDFEAFVRAMGAPERTVRRLINRELGHDHFRTFLNAHRVDEARRRLADPAHREDKLIAVAMDSGFNSLASFNRVFKEMEGRTPSAFRDAAAGALQDSGERSAGS